MVQLVAQGFKQSKQRRGLTTKSKYHMKTGLIWRHPTLDLPLSHIWVRSPTDFKLSKRILLYSHERVTGLPPPLSLPPKGLEILDFPVHLSCHFSVRTHHKGTLQPELGILMYLEHQYLSTTSKVNLSPKQSPNNKILFKHDDCGGRQGPSQIGYGINNSLFQTHY